MQGNGSAATTRGFSALSEPPIARADQSVAGRARTLMLGVPTALFSALVLLAVDDEQRMLAAPIIVLVNVGIWFLIVLWNRDSVVPVFDVGMLCLGFSLIYSVYPLFAFLMADGTWSQISDARLREWNPDTHAIGAFGWRYVAYVGAFAVIYVAVRGHGSASGARVPRLAPAEIAVALWLFLALTMYFGVIWFAFGVTYAPSYRAVQLGTVGVSPDLPHLLQQISHNFKAIILILKICGIAVLMQSWRSPLSRFTLAVWLSVEMIATFLRMGARTDTVMLSLSAVLLYHRLVRPFSVRAISAVGAGLVGMALLYGFARDFAHVRGELANVSYWSAANEFQGLMGTAYDLHMRKVTGALDPIPWQVHASDLLRLIPSQLLSFPKIEPAEWYLTQLGLDSRTMGFMFGVLSQAVIGFDWVELVVRGAALGMVLGVFHRLYLRHAGSFWWSMLYLCVCLWSYYTVRASTFYFLYFVVYQFTPAVLVVTVGATLVRRATAQVRVEDGTAA
jgi:hypothetical protein